MPHHRTGQGPLPPHATGQGPLPRRAPFPFPPRAQSGGRSKGVLTGCLTALLITLALLALLIGVLAWLSRGPAMGADGGPVQDGKLRFAVTGTTCAKPAKNAEVRACRVRLTVDNVGQEARVLYPAQQKMLDEIDNFYVATRLLDEDGKEITPVSIRPGRSFTGTLLFELPRDARPAQLEFHDSALSTGIRLVVD